MSAQEQSATKVAETERIARAMYEEVLNRANFAVLEQYVSEDYVYQNYLEPTHGRQQLIDLVEAQRAALEEYRVTIDHLVPGEDGFSVCWTVSGRLVGELFGWAPTGERVTYNGITVQRLQDGRAVEAWSFSNMAERLPQQGARRS